jgi:homoaconitase/3-isopropylmalate dehydratase large subunit
MKKDKLVNIEPHSKPVSSIKEQEQMETAEANMKLQDAFYDENESNGVDPANLNNQSAILTDMD